MPVSSNILKASLENNNTKPFWRHIKALRRDNIEVAPLINEGELHSDPSLKADLLSQQFESVFVRDSDQNGTPILPGTPFPNISNLFISEGGILKLLKGLDICDPSSRNQSHVGRVRFPLRPEMHVRPHDTYFSVYSFFLLNMRLTLIIILLLSVTI